MNPLFDGVSPNDSKELLIFCLETLHKELIKAKNVNLNVDENMDDTNQ